MQFASVVLVALEFGLLLFYLGKTVMLRHRDVTNKLSIRIHTSQMMYIVCINDEKIKSKIGPINIGDNRPETLPLFNNGLSFEIRMLYRIPT